MKPGRSSHEGQAGAVDIDGAIRDAGPPLTGGVGTGIRAGSGRAFAPRRYVQVGDTIEVQVERPGRPQQQVAFAA